jgi:cysteine desulfurase / selenocysteine lyase
MASAATSRRQFLGSLSGGLAGSLILRHAGEAAPLPSPELTPAAAGPNDEHYWGLVRTQFPLRAEPVYLNNGTMGPSPYPVLDAVRAEMEDIDRAGRYGGWDVARPVVASFINAEPEEISLTHNVTEGISVVACGIPLKPGDEVILTDHEHVGNALPWLARARRDGIVIRSFSPALTAAGTLERISSLLTGRTRAIAVPHITCTTGHVLPAKEICALGRSKNIYTMIDAAHTPGMMPLDVKAMGCDFLASCGHKWMLGPKGTGFLYVRKEMLEVLEPYWMGGGSDAGWDVRKGTMAFRGDAHRFDFASQNAALYVGLNAAIDFIDRIGIDTIRARDLMLAGHLRSRLEELGDRVKILTPSEEGSFGAVVAFQLKKTPYDVLYKFLLEERKITTRMVPESGVNCNRISTHIYNSRAEVDRLVEAVREKA